ncbi:MAG: alcohol dehydrogenase catalytic domain-containing protein [Candidatus Bipolaricaulota bacterium]|nr:MAG: alcohol dehydrogenase catalytic domain-containing protein [Candidatus Bipolaricaulota bacterium]
MTEMMRAIVWDGDLWPKGLELKEFPIPELRPGWVLVRNRAAGICGSDLHYLGGQTRHLIPDRNLPAVLGHENAGVVVKVGAGVGGLEPGDRVAVEPLHGCLETGRLPPCAACLAGHYELCEHHLTHVGIPLVEMLPGGYGEYSIVHASKAHKMPEGVSFEDAALLDVLAVGVHALGIGKPIPGMSAAVLGSGVIGVDLIQCLRAWGISEIIATARYHFQAEAAKKAGASAVVELGEGIDPVEEVLRLTDGRGVDQVYEGVGGKTDVVDEAIRMCRRGGLVIMTGIFDGRRPIDLLTMLFSGVSILSSNSYSITGMKSDYEIALDLLASGQATHDFVVTHRFAPEQFNEAIETAFDKKGNQCLRAMFVRTE